MIITAINIIGGFAIGTLQQGMPFVEALKTYTILTIGDGLVAQIPALLISTAAGMVVSRAGSDSDMGKDISKQLFVNPKVLLTTAGIMAVLGIVPGLPHIPFFLLSAASGGLAYALGPGRGGGTGCRGAAKGGSAARGSSRSRRSSSSNRSRTKSATVSSRSWRAARLSC